MLFCYFACKITAFLSNMQAFCDKMSLFRLRFMLDTCAKKLKKSEKSAKSSGYLQDSGKSSTFAGD